MQTFRSLTPSIIVGGIGRLAVLCACLVAAACGPAERTPARLEARLAEKAQTPSASRGLEYAATECAQCHAVAAGQTKSPVPKAPAFDAVANAPGMNALAFNAWLHISHPTMPNLIIDPERIADLSAYLATLRRPATAPKDL